MTWIRLRSRPRIGPGGCLRQVTPVCRGYKRPAPPSIPTDRAAIPPLPADTNCPSCGFRHNLCLPYGTLRLGRAYRYFCPRTAAGVTLKPVKDGESVHHYPEGVVRL